MKLAIFDFDGTIYKHETYSLMMEHAKHHPIYQDQFNAFYFSIVPPYAGYKLRLYPEDKMKLSLTQKYLQLFHQRTMDEVELFFGEIAEKMNGQFNELVLERMNKHHEEGYYIMVVSGAYRVLLETALANYPVDLIIGTEIPLNGTYVHSKETIDHIQGKRKTAKILEAVQGKQVDWDNSFAYGDSASDLPVLEMVGNPVAVCPDPTLQNLAHKNKWTVVC